MLLLKATETNWGRTGPGDWEKRTWKIDTDGTWQMKTTFNPVDGDPENQAEAVNGTLSQEQMTALIGYIDVYWSDEKPDACDGNAWEFKLYQNETVIRHRNTGYISGIEPFESITRLLNETEPDEETEYHRKLYKL